MNAKVEDASPENGIAPADYALIGAGVLVILAGIFAFYYFDPQWATWVRTLTVVAGLVGGMFISSRSNPGKQFMGFIDASIVELRKVVWPTRQETMQTTGVVIVAVIIVGIMLFIIDYSLTAFVRETMGG